MLILGKKIIFIIRLAKEIKGRPPHTDYVATRWYRSPEVILKSKNYNSPIDIFAVGAIMIELYNNKPVFPGKSEFDQMTKICDILGTPSQNEWAEGYVLAAKINYKFPSSKGHNLRQLVPRASDKAINLIESMLHFNPLKRPTAQQCLQHPFFQCHDLLYLYGLKLTSSMSTSNKNIIGTTSTPIRVSTVHLNKKNSATTSNTNSHTNSNTNLLLQQSFSTNNVSISKNLSKNSNKNNKFKFDEFLNHN